MEFNPLNPFAGAICVSHLYHNLTTPLSIPPPRLTPANGRLETRLPLRNPAVTWRPFICAQLTVHLTPSAPHPAQSHSTQRQTQTTSSELSLELSARHAPHQPTNQPNQRTTAQQPMGKCVRIRGGSKRNPSPSTTTGEAAAAACLTLRSGRRVPVAASSSACSTTPGSCRRQQRRCGAKRACGSPGRRKCASEARPPPRCRAAAALASADDLNGGRDRPAKEEGELLTSSSPLASPAARDVDGDRGDSA